MFAEKTIIICVKYKHTYTSLKSNNLIKSFDLDDSKKEIVPSGY